MRPQIVYSDTVTAVVAALTDANKIIQAAYHNYGAFLGAGLGKVAACSDRHLGQLNEPMVLQASASSW